MKRLIIPLVSCIAFPKAIQANIDSKFAEICMKAADFEGCIEYVCPEETRFIEYI